MSAPLGPAAYRVLAAIRQYRSRYGISPSVRDLMRALDLRSPAPVQFQLNRLKAAGLISWQPNRSRTVVLLPAALNVQSLEAS
jgi:repressor LexA